MKKLTLLAALAVASIGSAQALTVSGGSFTNAETPTEISQSGNLSLFDTNLGVLNSVQFTFNGSMTTSFSLTNNAAQAQNVSATGTSTLFAGSTNLGIDALINSISLALSAGSGLQNIASGATVNFGPLTDSDSLSVTLLSGLSAFHGIGSFAVTGASLSGINILGGGGQIASTQTTAAGIGASILYNYTERTTQVPEPAILGLMGLGFAAMGAMRRRRQS